MCSLISQLLQNYLSCEKKKCVLARWSLKTLLSELQAQIHSQPDSTLTLPQPLSYFTLLLLTLSFLQLFLYTL